jgi:hypothetical protein
VSLEGARWRLQHEEVVQHGAARACVSRTQLVKNSPRVVVCSDWDEWVRLHLHPPPRTRLAGAWRCARSAAPSRTSTRPPAASSDAKVKRIVTLGFGTARQRMVLERWTNTKPQRCTRSPRYGVRSCGGESAGVAKRPRERSPPRNL